MLTLQRASAGSGKTYTLTKKYILFLISIDKDGEICLRNKAELADSVGHILAVTFTNKATNEMKERILRELDLLAYPQKNKKSDYIDEFIKIFQCGAEDIRNVCRQALDFLLYEYQDFNVSTIDSYFQAILRTFSYESDLPDNFQVVIDSEYLTHAAVNLLLDDFEHGSLPADVEKWLRHLVDRNLKSGSKGWNVFQRTGNKDSVVGNIIKIAKEMDKEDFKPRLIALEKYFKDNADLNKVYQKIEEGIDNELSPLFRNVRRAAQDVIDAYSAISEDDWRTIIFGKTRTAAVLEKILAHDADPRQSLSLPVDAPQGDKLFASKVTKAVRSCADLVEAPVAVLCDAVAAWADYLRSQLPLWSLYADSFHILALAHDLRQRVDGILQDNDSVNLSDTNTMLRKIIGDDDVPFVYERMGTRLNHFLIDEFQDTSALQWHNFRPLLKESESRGNANLIIGDAKQSIYRFRNAEPRLILKTVPEEFPDHEARGFSEKDNTNWRSFRNIVFFNNYLFSRLSRELTPGIDDLYSNTVQCPASTADEGYVRVDFYQASSEEATDEDDDKQSLPRVVLEMTGRRVLSLLRRGYRQSEIAILVSSNKAGRIIINYLMEINEHLPADHPRLLIVSEESLTLSSSTAVNTVMECFRTIRNGMNGKLRRDAESDALTSTRLQWNDIADYYRQVSAVHPEMSPTEKLKECLNSDHVYTLLSSIRNRMQADTLPSLTEAIIGHFVDEKTRCEQAPFLAALQDSILEYCEVYPADVASLLRWWDSKGKNISVSSPDGTDAINVMTIHKSKGLEFPCVILPEINQNFSLMEERVWEKVDGSFHFADLLPETLPIKITKKGVENTPYSKVYDNLLYMKQMDTINKLYVALTRAACELFLILPMPNDKERNSAADKQTSNFSQGLDKLFPVENSTTDDNEIHSASPLSSTSEKFIPDPSEIRVTEPTVPEVDSHLSDTDYTDDPDLHPAIRKWIEYGSPVADISKSLKKIRDKHAIDENAITVKDYYVNNNDINIICQDEEETRPDSSADAPIARDPGNSHTPDNPDYEEILNNIIDEDRLDPRSEGNILHDVLSRVKVAEDLPRAFLRSLIRGALTEEEKEKYEPMLRNAIDSVADRHWFDGTYEIFNERELLNGKYKMKRPDRMMISSDGKKAIIVDYKFGKSENNDNHHWQVKAYAWRLRTSMPEASVSAYLWYLHEGKIEEVPLPS